MKKSLKTLLLSLSCACLLTATGCGLGKIVVTVHKNDTTTSETPEGTLKVTFVEGEGYSFECALKKDELVPVGGIVDFTVKMSAFYTGYPIVYINGKAIAPDDDGIYHVEMQEDIEVTVAGVQKDVSSMMGTGSFEDAFVVSKPIDLLYIAEQVNKGVYEYVTGAYVLANDIDCGGEELQIIGDMSTENSFFSGCFTCYTNAETGEMQAYTISNFTINSENANYVGLFGTVYADLSVTSSGLFYGIQLDNFTINARVSDEVMSANRSISVGGLIGYGVGANAYLCSATNGEINLYGDNNYFSFAGGLIGYQQAFYMPDYDMNFPSEVVYSTTDVTIRVLKGMALYAGGISGYVATNVPSGATAYIHNSYAYGDVSGALRAGGIAGGLGQYTSVGNCYATGEIYAKAGQSLDDILLTDTQYCYSNAGGIVGYAENDTIVNDCFFAGTTSATAVSAGCSQAGDIVGGGQEKGQLTASAEKYVINNCLAPSQLKTSMSDNNTLLKDTFKWGSFDWVFTGLNYPTINYTSATERQQATATFHYVADGKEITVNNEKKTEKKYFDTSNSSINIYAPMGNYFLTNSFDRTIVADNSAGENYLSYGYFFDEACTEKVPYSYVPQRDITLYIGFADATPILKEYQLAYNGSTDAINLQFKNNGQVDYSDGNTSQTSYYFFDGEKVIIEGARLARYYDGAIVVDETDTTVVADANFDLYRYNYYDFVGTFNDNTLSLYDGVYFTSEAPLTAKTELFRGSYHMDDATYNFYGSTATMSKGTKFVTYSYVKNGENLILTDSNGTQTTIAISNLKEFDEFKGTWTKSATVNKTYVFDGMGNWTYEYISYTRNGYTYDERIVVQEHGTYENGKLYLENDNTVYKTIQINTDGQLIVSSIDKDEIFYAQYSYVGTWKSANMTIEMLGIGANGVGKAILSYGDGMLHDLVYEVSETDGYVCLYWPHETYVKDALFGYFTYDAATNTLLSTLTDSNNTETGYTQGNLFIIDDYNGEWICNDTTFKSIEFSFNGNGLYSFLYGYAGMEGTLSLRLSDTETIELTYTLDSTLKGHFAYNGIRYVMEYDEDEKMVRITEKTAGGDTVSTLQRKDILAGKDFVDETGAIRYRFDGRSTFAEGGTLTIDGNTSYNYKAVAGGWKIFDGTATEIGTLALSANEAYYELTLNSVTTKLYLSNAFMGQWAIGGEYATMQIGPTDLHGYIQANFKGYEVEISTLEPNLLTFKYWEDKMPITYYLFVVEDEVLEYDVLVLSQYPNLYSGGYSICTKAHTLYGKWVNGTNEFTLRFDGITSGAFSNGVAELYRGTPGHTDYYYRIEKQGIMLWSQVVLGGKTQYYKIEMLDVASLTAADKTNADVFMKKDEHGNILAAFRRIEADGLLFVTAKDAEENTYFFDGGNVNGELGILSVNGVESYRYKILSYNDDSTASLELTSIADGTTYSATLDYSKQGEYTIKIGEIIDNT